MEKYKLEVRCPRCGITTELPELNGILNELWEMMKNGNIQEHKDKDEGREDPTPTS